MVAMTCQVFQRMAHQRTAQRDSVRVKSGYLRYGGLKSSRGSLQCRPAQVEVEELVVRKLARGLWILRLGSMVVVLVTMT